MSRAYFLLAVTMVLSRCATAGWRCGGATEAASVVECFLSNLRTTPSVRRSTVMNELPRGSAKVSTLEQKVGNDSVRDVLWESGDGACSMYFSVSNPATPDIFDEVRYRRVAADRASAGKALNAWLDAAGVGGSSRDPLKLALSGTSGYESVEIGTGSQRVNVSVAVTQDAGKWIAGLDVRRIVTSPSGMGGPF